MDRAHPSVTIKQKRPPNLKQVPELFSKAGVADWVNRPRKPDAAPGKDELWRPWHKQGRFLQRLMKPSDGASQTKRRKTRQDKTRAELGLHTLIRHEKEEFRNCLLERWIET